MSICTVSGTVLDVSGSPISGVVVDFNIQTPILVAGPVQGTTTTDASGNWSLTVQQGLSGVFTVHTAPISTSKTFPYRFNVNIPSSSTATFSSTVVDF